MYLTDVLEVAIRNQIRLIKVRWLGKTIARGDVRECSPAGIDSSPLAGTPALFSETSLNGQPVVISYIAKDRQVSQGEIKVYNLNHPTTSYIYCKNNNTIEIGGSANHMTQFEGLQTAFNQLRSDFNALVALYNLHVHSGGTIAGSTGTTTPGGTSSTADILPAKLTNIKTQ